MAGIQFRQQSINNVEINRGFTIFPNPNQGNFTVKWNGEVGEVFIKIFDISGRVVFSTSFTSDQTQISLANEYLMNGMYLAELFHKESNYTQHEKIFINK